ncbi:hypothetical protein [Streptomyces sp. NPDC001978]|uniref:hypothetical protein n=1 Tax=Streptomyces sp. NPDC001978 TaxID=3364627 RepID=UPI0036C1A8CF
MVLIVVCVSLPDALWGSGISPFGDTDSRDKLPYGVLFAFTAALAIPLWWRRRVCPSHSL